MRLVKYVQYAYETRDFDYAERLDISKGLKSPDRIVKWVRLSCRLEDEVLYKGNKIKLVSKDLMADVLDFQRYATDLSKDIDAVYAEKIAGVVERFKAIKLESLIEHPVEVVSYMRSFDIYHTEFYGDVSRVSSDRLSDIRVPGDCHWFKTFNQLEKQATINGISETLQSEPVDEKSYIIADVVKGFIRAYADGSEGKFIQLRDGRITQEFIKGEYISPRVLDEYGRITDQKVPDILYEDVKDEYWHEHEYYKP